MGQEVGWEEGRASGARPGGLRAFAWVETPDRGPGIHRVGWLLRKITDVGGEATLHPHVSGCGFPAMVPGSTFFAMESRSPAPAYVTSDAHLGAVSDDHTRALLRWLEWAAERASVLVVNGDLFDFWFEYRTVVPRGHTRLLGLLARIVDAGVPVHLMGGNHDWWGGSFLEEEIGVRFHRVPVRLDLAGHRVLVAHGDGVGRGDLGYRLLRTVIRSPLTRRIFRWIHPDVGAALARRVSRTEVRQRSEPGGSPERVRELERWARERLLEEEELDHVLLGHVHRLIQVEVAPDRFYLNTGDWLHHDSYAVLTPGEPPYLARWVDDREVRVGRTEASRDGSTR